MLKKKFAIYLQYKDKLLQLFSHLLSRLKDSRLIQWLIEQKDRISLLLNILWIVGCGYWFYQLIIIDARPRTDWNPGINDPREALVLLCFGVIGFLFVSFFAFFILKFIYNLFQGGIQSLFSMQWHSIVKSISYLVILYFAFSFTGNIKVLGLTTYNQFVEIVHTSRQQNIVVRRELPDDIVKKVSELRKLIEKNKEENEFQ